MRSFALIHLQALHLRLYVWPITLSPTCKCERVRALQERERFLKRAAPQCMHSENRFALSRRRAMRDPWCDAAEHANSEIFDIKEQKREREVARRIVLCVHEASFWKCWGALSSWDVEWMKTPLLLLCDDAWDFATGERDAPWAIWVYMWMQYEICWNAGFSRWFPCLLVIVYLVLYFKKLINLKNLKYFKKIIIYSIRFLFLI